MEKSRHILDSHGDINVFRVTDYRHPFDTYSGRTSLFLKNTGVILLSEIC